MTGEIELIWARHFGVRSVCRLPHSLAAVATVAGGVVKPVEAAKPHHTHVGVVVPVVARANVNKLSEQKAAFYPKPRKIKSCMQRAK